MAKRVENSDLFSGDVFLKTKQDVELLIGEITKLEAGLVSVAKAQKKILENSDTKSIQGIRATKNSIDKLNETEKIHSKLKEDRIRLENKLKSLRTNQAKQNSELNILIQQQNKLNKQSILENEKLSGAYAAQSARLNRLRKEYKDLAVSTGTSGKRAKELRNEITKLDTKLKQVDATVGQSQRNVGNYGSAFSKLGGVLRSGLGVLGITAGIAGIVRGVGEAIGIFKDFEAANSKLEAILRATTDEMDSLKKQAKELGATTAFTASEVTGLQIEFAKLGFPTSDIKNMTASTLDAAAAMGSDLGEQAALTGATLKAFGLKSKDTARVNDVLAKSTTRSALDFSKLNASMSTIAPVAKAMGFGLEDTVSLLGNLSDSGFDASTAATATRNIMLKLADSSSVLGKRLKEPVKDLPSLIKGLKQLKSEGVNLSEALELTDVRSVAAFSTFLEGTDSLEKLSAELHNADGAAKEMAETMLNNLSGDMTKAQSAWEGFVLSLEDGSGVMSNALRKATQQLTTFLGLLTDLNNPDKKQSFESFANSWHKAMTGVDLGVKTLDDHVNSITKSFQKLSDEQILSKEVGKAYVKSLVDVGLSAKGAVEKLKELRAGVETETGIIDANTKSTNANVSAKKKAIEVTKDYSKELEDVQNRLIKDDLDRQIAQIETEFKRKIEAIKGNSKTENELRELLRIERNRKEDELIKKYDDDELKREKEKADKLQKILDDAAKKRLDEEKKQDDERFKIEQENEKKRLEQRKELTQAAIEIISSMIDEQNKRELEAMDKQISATSKRVDQLNRKAELGQLANDENRAYEEKKLAQLEKEKIKEQQRQQREQALFTVISTYQNKIANNDPNPLLSTIKDIGVLKAFAATLAGFYEGTDDVGASLGKPQLSGKDGHIIRVDGKEQIWSAKDREEVGYRSRREIKDLVGLVDNKIIKNITNQPFSTSAFALNGMMNEQFLNELSGIKEAINKIDIPEGMVDIDQVRGLINLYSRKANKKTIERSKLFS